MYFNEQGQYVFLHVEFVVTCSVFSLYIFNAPSSVLQSCYFKVRFLLAPNLLATAYISLYSLSYFMEKIEAKT